MTFGISTREACCKPINVVERVAQDGEGLHQKNINQNLNRQSKALHLTQFIKHFQVIWVKQAAALAFVDSIFLILQHENINRVR